MKTLRTFFFHYALVGMVTGLALWQMYEVYNNSLTRWKGGGFGMYAEVHYGARYFWAMSRQLAVPVRLDSINTKDSKFKLAYLNAQRQPNQRHLQKLTTETGRILSVAVDTLELWAPNVSDLQGQFSMQPIRSFIAAQQKMVIHEK